MQFPSSITASGLPWVSRAGDARMVQAIAQQHGISEMMAEILVGRGVMLDDVQHFLNPSLRDYLPDPFHLLDMDKAVARIIDAMEVGEPMAVFGDYDVDGATSSAVLMQYFAQLGIAINPYIPDRMKEGYGPTIAGFDALIARGTKLIITVDCGTLSFAPIAHAKAKGVDVIVVDHHLSNGGLPEAHAVVNPNRVDESSPLRNLAAVGVTFLLLVALNKRLRERGFFAQHNQKEPNLLALLDIVALGTVCDVMTLTGLNRAFVAQGLKVMAGRRSIGLTSLSDVARMDEAPNVYHLGFLLGPRVNAGGRVGVSDLGVRLLTTSNHAEAADIAKQLDHYNAERQAIEASVLEQALLLAEAQQNMPVIMVAQQGWHPGVIGIVAGRLKERYQRPVAVVALDQGVGKASARSVTGADFGAAVHAALAEGLLVAGGGHAMAAGFTVAEEQIAALQAFLCSRMGAAVASYQEGRLLKHDGFLSVAGATLATLEEIAQAGPYGLGNPGPRFVLRDARIVHRSIMKEKHLKLVLSDVSGNGRVNAVAFNAMGSVLGEWLQTAPSLHVLGELKRNRWQGQDSAQFMIDDVAKVG